MAIQQVDIGVGVSPEPNRRRYWIVGLGVVLGLGLLPIVIEGTYLCYGRWMEALDRPVDVRTPILDKISETVRGMGEGASLDLHSFFEHAAWDPTAVLVVGVAVMGAAMLMLRSK
jgi:hypothetical protein